MAILKFLTDENISPRVVRALRESGYDVIDVKEQRRFGWLDERVLGWARAEECVVLTHDSDFAELLKQPFAKRHAGVILIQLHHQDAPHVIASLMPVITRFRSRRLHNALIILGDNSVEYLRG